MLLTFSPPTVSWQDVYKFASTVEMSLSSSTCSIDAFPTSSFKTLVSRMAQIQIANASLEKSQGKLCTNI